MPWSIEWVQKGLLVAGLGATGVVMLGGMMGKSTAWMGTVDHEGMGWTDGVKPWAIWAFLGGIVVVGLLLIGRSRGDGLWLVAGASAFLLWHAGNEASAYRARLEAGMFTNYDHHRVSFGLRVVPTAGTIGAIVVGVLAVITLGITMSRRAALSPSG